MHQIKKIRIQKFIKIIKSHQFYEVIVRNDNVKI